MCVGDHDDSLWKVERWKNIPPPDYEKELLAKKESLKQDEFPNLLLFPQKDVTVCNNAS